MYGIVANSQDNWTSLVAWIFLGAGVIALIVLIILDNFRKHPLLDLHIFKEKLMVLSALSCSLAGVASTVFMFFDPLYLRIVRGMSPFLIGLLLAVIPAAQALISFFFASAVKTYGVANLLIFSIAAGFTAFALHWPITADFPILALIAPFFLLGVNWGLSNSTSIAAVNQVIPQSHIAAAFGTIATIWNIVGSILLAASTAVFHAVEKQHSFLPAFHEAVDFNIIVAAIFVVAGVILYLSLKGKKA